MSQNSNTDSNGLKKSLKDIEKIEDLDIDNIELLRGETPVDIKEKCLQLCKDYLSGNWIKQTLDTIEVRRVSGGMTNQLYYCGICEKSSEEGVPQEVAVRLYGPKYFNYFDCDGNERLTDVVIALMVSQNKLGPKVYGVFEGGQIHAYYRHRQFKHEEQKDPKLVTEVFQKLARVHAMDVPIKRRHWVFHEMDRFYELGQKNEPFFEIIKELNCETLLNNPLKTEVEWIKELVLKTNSPMVFTHNDFRSSNIMVLEDNNNVGAEDEAIVLCDFEYSSYGYRGHDFGVIMNEWDRKWSEMTELHTFVADEKIISLLEIYLKESQRILGQTYAENPMNSLKQLLKEVKVFSIFTGLFFVLFTMKNDETTEDSFPMNPRLTAQFAETFYKNYFHLKKQFVEQKAFEM